MPKKTTDQTLSPGEPGTPEPNAEAAGAGASEDTADAENQALPPSSESPKAAATQQLTKVKGIPDYGKAENDSFYDYRCEYSVDSATASDIKKMAARAQSLRSPRSGIPFPTGRERFGTTDELFARIKQTIAEQTRLSDGGSALLTFLTFSTWFQEVLALAPGLVITGRAYEGDVILRTLKAFCRHPYLLAGISSAVLNHVPWHLCPTLLIGDTNLSKRMAFFLSSSTRPGYMSLIKLDLVPPFLYDFYGSKAIYVGEDLPFESMRLNCLHLNASLTSGVESQYAPHLSKEVIQRFQNQLLDYRIRSLPTVFKSSFNPPGLSPEVTAMAKALGSCIVDAPDLQVELVALLKPYSEQQLADRLDDLGMLAISAALVLCHAGKEQARVGEIAAEVNRMQKARGETLQYSPEKVGHRLRKSGLLTRRLSALGNGLLFDLATKALLHDVASAYGCAGLTNRDENLHCPLCNDNKGVM